VYLPGGTGGLERDSIALCHQVTTLDRAKLTRRLGTLPENLAGEVNDGLKAALDLE
jgi:mRNA-degrading endonuclease toxin of MazEF toxin-antitoxin module